MENKLEDFLKNKMSLDEMGMEEPNPSLVNEARNKIILRKKTATKKPGFFAMLSELFTPKLKLYYTGFASLLVIFGIIYLLKSENGKKDSYMNEYSNTKTSVNSSTVLASLTQYTLNNASVKSSTVLSCIMTCVVKN